MHLRVVLVVALASASCVQSASFLFHRSQDLQSIQRLCASAQRHAVDARDLFLVAPSDIVFPAQTVLGRCDADEACCADGSERRAVLVDSKTLVFVVYDAVNKRNERHVSVEVEDHVRCGCVDVVVDQATVVTEPDPDVSNDVALS